MEALESTNWMQKGYCRDMPPDLFFSYNEEDQAIALSACGSCAVRSQCLEYALENRIDHGIWGGTTEDDRRKIRRAQRDSMKQAG